MSLPKTLEEVIVASQALVMVQAGFPVERLVEAVLLAAGLKLGDDGNTLIYPSTSGNTPRYQVPEQRNVRFRGGRRK